METAEMVKIDEQKVLTIAGQASTLTVCDQPTYNRAVDLLKTIKGLRDEIKLSYKDTVVAKAYDAYKSALGFFQKNDEPLRIGEERIKGLILNFDRQKKDEEDRKQRAAEAKARAEAQAKADKLAAEAKARADAEAKAAKERADKELAAAKKSGASRAEVAEIKERAEERIEQIQGSAVQQINEIRTTADYVPPAPPVKAYERAAGVATRKNWDGEIVDMPRFLYYLVTGKELAPGVGIPLVHPEFLNLVNGNETAIRMLAKAQEDKMRIPGVRSFDKGGVSASKF